MCSSSRQPRASIFELKLEAARRAQPANCWRREDQREAAQYLVHVSAANPTQDCVHRKLGCRTLAPGVEDDEEGCGVRCRRAVQKRESADREDVRDALGLLKMLFIWSTTTDVR